MPTITPAVTLIKATNNLADAILCHSPKTSVTADVVKQFMEIYKIQADQTTCAARAQRVVTADAVKQFREIYKILADQATYAARAQRVLREQALAQRVAKEQQAVEPVQANNKHTSTTIPNFEVKDNQANDPRATNGPPVISQDEDSPPAANTRQQRQTQMLTQDYMFQMMEIPGYKAPFTPSQAAARKYPLQILCDFAYAILDKDTGDLLEYRLLIKHPKYAET
jgi:hypothetical protein